MVGRLHTVTITAPVHARVARNVRAIAAVHNLSQAQLAAWIGTSTAQMSRLLSGQRVWTLDNLDNLAEHLGVTVSLLTGPLGELMRDLPTLPFSPDGETQTRLLPPTFARSLVGAAA